MPLTLARSLTIDNTGLSRFVLAAAADEAAAMASCTGEETSNSSKLPPISVENQAGSGLLQDRPSHPMSPFCSAAEDLASAFDMKLADKADPAASPQLLQQKTVVDMKDPRPPGAGTISSMASDFARFGSCNLSCLVGPADQSCGPAPSNGCPPHGVKAVCGKRAKMEDTFVVQINFFDMPLSPMDDQRDKLPARFMQQLEASPRPGESPLGSAPISPTARGTNPVSEQQEPVGMLSSCAGSDSSGGSTAAAANDTLHFFGVYDGHGGAEAAQHCANRLHQHLSEALANVSNCILPELHCEGPTCHADWALSGEHAVADRVGSDEAAALDPPSSPNFSNLKSSSYNSAQTDVSDLQSLDPCDRPGSLEMPGYSSPSSSSRGSDAHSINSLLEDALRDAFLKTDQEFATDSCASMVGSTAVVALLGTRKMWVANCGDSRAVLCRGGRAVQLTDDHKPEREDEAERVEKAGGQVLYWNGHRVMGVLAMSRAIGDHGLRPYVISEPEITVLSRTEDDDFLLLASDGLWDVMSNQEATVLAIRCLTRAREKGASRKAAVRIAANVLTKAAIDRGSKDNVTVVIVDLKATGDSAVPATAVHDGLVVDLEPCGMAGDVSCSTTPITTAFNSGMPAAVKAVPPMFIAEDAITPQPTSTICNNSIPATVKVVLPMYHASDGSTPREVPPMCPDARNLQI